MAEVLTLVWTVALPLVQRRSTRKERIEDKAAADARSQVQAAAVADAELVGKDWRFKHRLRAVVGDGEPREPPIEISVTGANVWVHEVRLSWRPSRPGSITPWTTKDGLCPAWDDDEPLPFHLKTGGRALRLRWPGPNPTEQVQLEPSSR